MAAKKVTSPDPKNSKTPIIQVSKEKQDLRKKEPPLVDIKVTNPLTYLKSWWKKIIGNEGIDFRFRVRPLTAIAISIIIITVSAGLGKFVLPFKIPFFEYTSEPTPTPTPNPWRETAFSGTLRFTAASRVFYLSTASSEAITLDVPNNIDLEKLIGSRIFATGIYNPETRTLKVTETANLEILPEDIELVPIVSPSPEPAASQLPIPPSSNPESTQSSAAR